MRRLVAQNRCAVFKQSAENSASSIYCVRLFSSTRMKSNEWQQTLTFTKKSENVDISSGKYMHAATGIERERALMNQRSYLFGRENNEIRHDAPTKGAACPKAWPRRSFISWRWWSSWWYPPSSGWSSAPTTFPILQVCSRSLVHPFFLRSSNGNTCLNIFNFIVFKQRSLITLLCKLCRLS